MHPAGLQHFSANLQDFPSVRRVACGHGFLEAFVIRMRCACVVLMCGLAGTAAAQPFPASMRWADAGRPAQSDGARAQVDRSGVRIGDGPAALSVASATLMMAGGVERAPLAEAVTRASRRNWFARHPVLGGTLVGTLAGAAAAHARWGAEGTFVGVYVGGGAGALVGWLISR